MALHLSKPILGTHSTFKVPLHKTIIIFGMVALMATPPLQAQNIKKSNSGSYIEYPQVKNLKKLKNQYYYDKANNRYQLYSDSRGTYYLKQLPQKSTWYTNRYTKVYIKQNTKK